MLKRFLLLLPLFATLSLVSPVQADTGEKLIKLLIKKGIITEDEAEALIEEAINEKEVTVKYDNGFKMATRDDDFKLQLGGRVQTDLRVYNSDHPEDNTFDVRRARLFAQGRLYRFWDFKVQVELEGGSSSRLRDGHFTFNYFKNAQLRFGQFKQPFSLDVLTSSKYGDFIERSTLSALAPARDVGVMLYGPLFRETLNYQLAVSNGNGVDANGEDNDDKDVALRLVVTPFGNGASVFRDLHLGGNFTYGREDDDTVSVRTEARTRFFEFDDVDVDDRTRFGGDLAWVYGPFALKGEYVTVAYDDIEEGTAGGDFSADIDAWYVSATYFLTGENSKWKTGTFRRISPRKNFDPKNGGFGAWQVGFRYSQFDAENKFITKGVVDDDYVDDADAWTIALSWWPNPMVRLMANYVHTDFDGKLRTGGESLSDEDVFLMRFQLEF
jgi:phosphate-selective porin OprO/OprP